MTAEKLQELFALYGLNVLGAILILLIGWLLAKLARQIVKGVLARGKLAEVAIGFVASLTYVAVIVFTVIAALGVLGIQTATFAAVLAAAGLAIGLALQGSLANFAAGFLIVVFRPFKVGDYIEGAGVAGTVETIELFTTTLRSPDNKSIIVPNAKMTGDNIVNYSAKDTRRVDMVFGISYGDDIAKAQQALMDLMRADARVLDDPAPVVVVAELGDSSVNLFARPWVKTADFWDVKFDITRQAKLRFDEAGITIPFPQRDVHVYSEPAK